MTTRQLKEISFNEAISCVSYLSMLAQRFKIKYHIANSKLEKKRVEDTTDSDNDNSSYKIGTNTPKISSHQYKIQANNANNKENFSYRASDNNNMPDVLLDDLGDELNRIEKNAENLGFPSKYNGYYIKSCRMKGGVFKNSVYVAVPSREPEFFHTEKKAADKILGLFDDPKQCAHSNGQGFKVRKINGRI